MTILVTDSHVPGHSCRPNQVSRTLDHTLVVSGYLDKISYFASGTTEYEITCLENKVVDPRLWTVTIDIVYNI
jgi:hypothetical protein